MKCPACWADKAYVRQVTGLRGAILSCLFLVPLRCHHCYHKFNVLRLFTIGKRLTPPILKAPRQAPAYPVIAGSIAPSVARSTETTGAPERRRVA
jgi:hypothetical protein